MHPKQSYVDGVDLAGIRQGLDSRGKSKNFVEYIGSTSGGTEKKVPRTEYQAELWLCSAFEGNTCRSYRLKDSRCRWREQLNPHQPLSLEGQAARN